MSGQVELTLLFSGWATPDVRSEEPDSAASRGAGCPGRSQDVRADGASFCAPWTQVPDVRDFGRISGGGRMSGLGTGCPVAVVSSAEG